MSHFLDLTYSYLFSDHLPTRIASWGILVLGLFTLLFVGQMLISRIIKTRYDRLREEAHINIETLLTDFVFDEERYPRSSGEYTQLLISLRKLGSRNYSRKILVETLLSLHRNLKGSPEERLQHLYADLHIKKRGLEILRDGEWYEKAFIIKELSQMNAKEALPVIMKYINHYNRVLREESQFAAVNLGGIANLEFLLNLKNPISEWQQTRILQHLDQHFHNQLPSFYYLLKARNISVVIFALKLIRHFRQLGDMQLLLKVFRIENEKVQLNVIDCMVRLEDPEGAEFLRSEFSYHSPKVQVKMIEALGTLGDSGDYHFLTGFLTYEDYAYVMAASRALLKLGYNVNPYDIDISDLNQQILIHAQHELLV